MDWLGKNLSYLFKEWKVIFLRLSVISLEELAIQQLKKCRKIHDKLKY